MKVTKVDGISHKKYIEEGKLVKSTSEENRTSERLSELLSIRLDIYIKNPDNASDDRLNSIFFVFDCMYKPQLIIL